jgi:ATP-dependent Clp protease ATP-binding subunit ClpB
LIGSPPGYVGHDDGGQLTEAVRRRPYTVILFDEVEKAHPDTFNVLLQVLDDGRLTDGQGRTVDFRNTLVIMTSNIGSSFILEFQKSGGEFEEMREHVLNDVQSFFRPEFLNRIDEKVVFHGLTEDMLTTIVDKQLSFLNARLEGRKMKIWPTEAVKGALARQGYDPTMGARPLKRLIKKEIENRLANAILKGQFGPKDHIQIDWSSAEGWTFEKIDAPAPAAVSAAKDAASDATPPAGAALEGDTHPISKPLDADDVDGALSKEKKTDKPEGEQK